MRYKIVCDGKVIAAFQHKADRDVCLDALRERFDDSEFTAVEIGG